MRFYFKYMIMCLAVSSSFFSLYSMDFRSVMRKEVVARLSKIEPEFLMQNPQLESQLKEIYFSAFRAVYGQDVWPLFDGYFERFKNNESMLLVTATLQDAVVGWSLFLVENQKAIIELICIDPVYWRKGIGRKLVFAIRDYLPKINHIAVVTRKVNLVSPYFYESLGFKKTAFALAEYDADLMQGFEWEL